MNAMLPENLISYEQSLSGTERRALELLGSGVPPESVAIAVGVDPSRISQLLAKEEFSAIVANKRYLALAAHSKRDAEYDHIEDELLKRLKGNICLMTKPQELLRAIQVINGAKRTGQSTPAAITAQQTVVNINLPQAAVSKFITNQQNQVIQAGNQELLTMQSGSLMREARQKLQLPQEDSNHGSTGREEPSSPTIRINPPEAASAEQTAGRFGAALNFIPVGSK